MTNNNPKILVIDDLQDNLITLNALIKDAFPEAIALNAQSGKKGLELATKENPDVILLDILMPGMDGYEVCQKLKADKELCDIPVVFVTAIENNKEALIKALESGGEAFLTKPIDEIELTAQIRAMLKIREANNAKKNEKFRLEKLVEKRSKELVKELAARKQAEEELLRYQIFLKSSLESFKDIIVLSIDKNYNYLYFNKAHIDVMQHAYNIEIEIGMNLLDCMTSDDDIRKAKINYDRALAGESHSTIEAYGDVQRSYYETFYNPIRNEKNEIIGTTAMARDITDRIQAEEKLKESEEKFRALYDNAPLSYQSLNEDGSFNDVNPTWLSTLGYERDEVIGKFYKDFLHPDWQPHFEKNFPAFKKRGYVHDVQFKIRHKKGHYLDISFEGCVGYNPDGSFKQTYCVFQDITERRKAEEELKESEERFRNLVNTINSGVAIYKVINEGKSGGDYIIQDFNQFALKHEKINKEEVIGKSLKDIRPNIDEYGLIDVFRKVWETGESTYFPAKVYKDEKYSNYYENRVFKLPSGEIVAVYDDVTERERAELALKESEERFNLAMNASNDGLFDWDLLTNEIYYSRAWKKMIGYEDHELPNDFSVWETTTEPEDVKKSWKLQQKLISKQIDRFVFEFKMKHKDGHWVDILSRARAIFDDEGKAIRIVGTHTDITERKQAEEKIIQQNEFLNNIMESLTYPFYVLDINDYSILQGNSASGFREIPNKTTCHALTHNSNVPCNSQDHPCPIEIIKKTRQPAMVEHIHFDEDGNKKDVEIYCYPIFDKNGAIRSAIEYSLDVTERKRTETEIVKVNRRLKISTESARIGIWEFDLKKNILTWDKRMFELYGIEPENFDGAYETWKKGVHPDDIERSNKEVQAAIAGEKEFHTQFRVVWPDGQIRFLEAHAIVNHDPDGTPISMVGVNWDITERKQAEAELLKLSTAVQQSPSVIAITDTKGNLQYVNPKFNESTGYSMEEVIGKNPRILKSGKQSYEFYKELWEIISSGKVWRGEFLNKKKNGELFWELASVSPIFNVQGKIINYIKVAEDITERKQADDNFRHSIDESPLGIRIVNQAGKTIYVNKALLDIYEFSSPEEFLNTSPIETYTGKSYQEHQERKKIRQKGGDAYDYEISIRRKNGEIRHIKVWRKEVIWDREKHFQVINQDITELKRLNTDLILAKEKAEESNRLKTAFLNNMSHEIRTPLNGITGFIGLLQDSEIDDEQKQHYFDIINKSSDRLIATVTDIIDISRIEAGLVKVSKTEVSVNEILEEQFKFFYHEAKSKGLKLIYKPGLTDSEARFITDKHKLEGILTNLIKNAIKFTDQGEITFACSLKKEQNNEILEFYVKDTGVGIPANRIEAIFNRFEQADIEDTRAHQGSGLGLAIAKSYIEMLGGEIAVSSEVGLGSTFTFSIPYTKQLVKESDAKRNINKETQTALSNLSVIIAEDDEASIMYFDAIFKNEYKNITYTKTGKETINKCREYPETDLILMDIKMPGMNGYDATREIRKFNSDVIIIAQTAFGLSGDREKAIEAGCNDYIAKPIKKEELEIIIKKHFKNYKRFNTN